ncbi:bifunctional salicylyl-CoA 5-hydroxylase/oxidoreductase [Roseateles sp. BYS180W]|uniref:Bifunctional salicylyl-CoA 5-hydroxylase/oxidoreductase n=1 Tax=Roseateles rivi TaxID=3299028 RepID=A0ABW7FYV9_9BURK
MRVTILGGGPAGLYAAILLKQLQPGHDVQVYERNQAGDTFGWGVVFSDQTLQGLREADEPTATQILDAFNHWDDIAVHVRGQRIVSGGHGFCGIGRQRLLDILQQRCEQLGVALHFGTEAPDDETLQADLIIAADGINSLVRGKYSAHYQPDIDLRQCRFVWLGTTRLFEAFTFDFQETPWGWFQAHAYRYNETHSTFIVEAPDAVWQAAGLEQMDKEQSIAWCEQLFAGVLQGHKLVSNAKHLRGSAQWIRFPRVVCQNWVHRNSRGVPVVLLGDAAHTAHFSIGSGTKLAFEDGIALARALRDTPEHLDQALQRYEAERRVEVLRIQNAARNSTEWFENVQRHMQLQPEQFAYSLLTRSQRISHENLRLRDAAYVAHYERWLAQRSGLQTQQAVPPMFTPLKVRGLSLQNRVVVSPMAQYACRDGLVAEHHLVHLGARAMGGAALVFTEMTAPSPEGRITPGCPGLWSDEQTAAWARIVRYAHEHSGACMALQLGHAGPKGATRVAWEGIDQPLPAAEAWPLLAASPQQYLPGVSDWAHAMTQAQMEQVRQDFVAATRRAHAAGFDWLELHCAHGYLLSSFISPLTNQRTDAYGGSLQNRLRFPLEVFAAMREVWPQSKPMSVRISACDWVAGGTTVEDAVAMAKAFKEAGCDLIDVSSGQVSKAEQPVYGRMWQTPLSERVRNEAGILTIAVGAISEADHVNSIIAAGRADLCAVARPHLAHPAWTLQEAARIGYTQGPGLLWPKPYASAKVQLERDFARQQSQGVAAQERSNRNLGV